MNGGRSLRQLPFGDNFAPVPPGMTEEQFINWDEDQRTQAYFRSITPSPKARVVRYADDFDYGLTGHSDMPTPPKRLLKAPPVELTASFTPGSAHSTDDGSSNTERALLQDDFGREFQRPLTDIAQMERDGEFRGDFAMEDPHKLDKNALKPPMRKLMTAGNYLNSGRALLQDPLPTVVPAL